MIGAREPNGAPKRVGVVIWDGSVPEEELRRQLGGALPLRFVRWQDRSYLATINQLRPRVIVVVEPDDELAADAAGLLALLITAYTPTIIAVTWSPISAHSIGGAGYIPSVHVLVCQLGPMESAWIESLGDLRYI
jgi:hypothetical protein